MKQRRAALARSMVDEVEDPDQPPELFDNPFHIRSEGDEEAQPPPDAAATPVEPVTEADRYDALDLTTVRPQASTAPVTAPGTAPERTAVRPSPGFLPSTPPRLGVESALVRVIATAGVVAIGTAVGAGLVANDVEGWIVGLVVSVVSVLLAAILWRSRRL